MFTGVAIRQAQALRLGSEFNSRLTNRQKEINRRTFWSCFILDRLVSYCCSRPQMIDLYTVRLNLPSPQNAFVFDEHYQGFDLTSFSPPTAQVSHTGITPFFLLLVSLWAKAAYHVVGSGRKDAAHTPTNPKGSFNQIESKIINFIDQLPSSMMWSIENYKLHRSTGQARLFVSFHFLLNHARFIMHYEYLPQLDSPAPEQVDSPDANQHIEAHELDEKVVSASVSSAEQISTMVCELKNLDLSDASTLQSIFAANALTAAASVQMWIRHTELSDGETTDLAEGRFLQITTLISSWQEHWPVAPAWIDTLDSIKQLYQASYLGQWASVPEVDDPGNMPADIPSPASNPSNGDTSTAVCEGNGVPDPSQVSQRLFDKLRITLLAALERTPVKKRLNNALIRTLREHMWQFNANQDHPSRLSTESFLDGIWADLDNVDLDFPLDTDTFY